MSSTFLGWGSCGPTWTIDDGQDHPHLTWEDTPGQIVPSPAYGGGTGTAEDPYLIYTAEELDSIGQAVCDWDKHFRLMANIDLSAFDGKEGRPAFNVIGTGGSAFAGFFDGNGHTISHLTLAGDSYVGLFGRLAATAQVKNVGAVDVNIFGSDGYVAGLVGYNSGTVTQCYSTGTVSGWLYGVGGLVGYNDGTVTQCYSTAEVSGYWDARGLVGVNWGTVTASFWDTQTSGQTEGGGGTGKTTAEMQTAKTFLDAGWDFVGETANGTEDIWWIDEGKDYPHLWRELIPEN